MLKIAETFAALLLAASFSGCNSAKPYFENRYRDVCDVFTVTYGVGLGAQARLGPVHGGLCGYHDIAGLRGGEFVQYPSGFDPRGSSYAAISADITLMSYEYFDPKQNDFAYPERHKSYWDEGVPFISRIHTPNENAPIIHPCYTQVEVVAAIIGGTRVGFNLGELFDFILGWTNVDIYRDDICHSTSHSTPRQQANQALERTAIAAVRPTSS